MDGQKAAEGKPDVWRFARAISRAVENHRYSDPVKRPPTHGGCSSLAADSMTAPIGAQIHR